MRALTYLDLEHNQIGDPGMIEFSRSIAIGSLGALQKLFLYGNQIGDAGMVEFSRAITSGSRANLEELLLGGNQIGNASMVALVGAIGSLPSMTLLSIQNNNISGCIPCFPAVYRLYTYIDGRYASQQVVCHIFFQSCLLGY